MADNGKGEVVRVDWVQFSSYVKGFGTPDVEGVDFASTPSDVRALLHRLPAQVARDVYRAYEVMVKPDVAPERRVDALKSFISSGHTDGAPWAHENVVRQIHIEHVKSLDWDAPSGGSGRAPF